MKPIYFDIDSQLSESQSKALEMLTNNADLVDALIEVLRVKQNLLINLGGQTLANPHEYVKLFGICEGLKVASHTIKGISEGRKNI